jgi:hypothetical protein
MLALVQAQGLIDPNPSGKTRILGQLAKPRVQFAFSIRGA